MLTPTDRKNIAGFVKLKTNHQRVFKHRLIKKCVSSLKDIEFVLNNYEKLGIKINRALDIHQLLNLVELYENLSLLQNV